MVRLLNHLNPLVRFQKKRAFEGIHSSREFYAVLQQERARSDRTGDRFSLVLFDIADSSGDQTLALYLVGILTQRIRSTDEVGWFDTQRIGVVMPNTPTEGAWRLADEICEKIAKEKRPLNFKVFTYPSEWLTRDTDNPANYQSARNTLYGGGSSATHSGEVKMSNCQRIVEGLETILVRGMPAWKRSMDILGSLAGIVITMPVMVLIAFAVKLTSPGPILFRQRRIGYGGRPFIVYKFRSMVSSATDDLHTKYLDELIKGKARQNSDGTFKIKDDSRTTAVGRFIRKWSLDELPQLFNVLKGDMSLVGPRPEPCYVIPNYCCWYHRRTMDSKPGLTGFWQVEGRSRVSYENMIRMDIKYCQTLSFLRDMELIIRTFKAVLNHSGAY